MRLVAMSLSVRGIFISIMEFSQFLPRGEGWGPAPQQVGSITLVRCTIFKVKVGQEKKSIVKILLYTLIKMAAQKDEWFKSNLHPCTPPPLNVFCHCKYLFMRLMAMSLSDLGNFAQIWNFQNLTRGRVMGPASLKSRKNNYCVIHHFEGLG